MDFLKSIGGKIVTGITALAVVAAGISWWQTDPATRQAILTNTSRIAGWIGVVLMVPWAGFFVIGWVARKESNAAGAILVLLVTIAEAAALTWMFHGPPATRSGWILAIAIVLTSAVYNLFVCDWIAEKLE